MTSTRALVMAVALSACTKSTPDPATVSTATTSAMTTTPPPPTSPSTPPPLPLPVASDDWTRDCPIDPDPSRAATLYGHGLARFVTPDTNVHDFKVEIASSEAAHERGLMYRTALADDAGMVFVFPEPHHAIFWMKNTCLPLDMIFVGEDDKVIGVLTAPRLNQEAREVPGFSRYVVELAAGRARALGIGLGTRFVPPALP